MEEVQPLIERIVEVIRTCYHPEIPVNICELGLIYDIRISEGNDLSVKMTLTSPNCPVAETLPAEVEQKLENIPELNSVKVEVTFDPPWEREMMSEEAKMELGMW